MSSPKTWVLVIRLPAHQAGSASDELWRLDRIQGIEELPADGGALFSVRPEHEFLEFGSEAARQCAEWLESEQYRGGGHLLLRAYREANSVTEAREGVEAALSDLDADILSADVLPDRDYLAEYRKSVKGQTCGRNLWIGPPWDQAPAGREAFFVDPGLAFGTGDHPTTQMCLARLERWRDQKASPRRILDLGTGSGLLAVAARRYFPAARIVASDLDPLCGAELQKTCDLNGVDPSSIQSFFGPAGSIDSVLRAEDSFDWLISNIYAEVLVSLLPSIHRALQPGGRWTVSGILNEGETLLTKAAESVGFRRTHHESQTKLRPLLESSQGLSQEEEVWHCLEFTRSG